MKKLLLLLLSGISHNRTASSKQWRGEGEAQKCTSACINRHHPAPRGLKHPAEQPILHPSLQLLNPPAKPLAIPSQSLRTRFFPGAVSFLPGCFRGQPGAGPPCLGQGPLAWGSPWGQPPGWQRPSPGQAGLTDGLGAEDALCLWFVCLFWVYTIIKKSLVLAGNFKRTKQNKETAPSRLIAATVTCQSFFFPWG